MHSERTKLIRDTAFSFVGPISQNLSGFVIMIFIAKYIGAIGYGTWSQFNATISLFASLLCLNLGHSMLRFLAGDKEKKYLSLVFSSVLFLVIILSLVVGLFLFIFKKPISDFFFGQKNDSIFVVLMALVLVLRILNTECSSFLRSRRYIMLINLVSLTYFILLSILIVISSVLTQNIIWCIYSVIFVEVSMLIFQLAFIVRKDVGFVRPKIKSLFPLLLFGMPLLMTSFGSWVVQASDRYIIKYFMGIYQVGVYSVGYSLALLLLFVWQVFFFVLFPDLSALYDRGEKKELEIRFSRILKYGVALSLAAVVGLSVLSVPIIKTVSSEEFLGATGVLKLVSMAMFFYGIFMHFSLLLNILKKVMTFNFIWLVLASINVFFNLILVPKFGIMGAAFSNLICFSSGTILIIYYSRRYFNLIFKLSWLVKMVFSCLIMGLAVSLFPVSSTLSLIVAVGSGMVVYGGSLLLIRFFDRTELLLVKDTFLSKLKK